MTETGYTISVEINIDFCCPRKRLSFLEPLFSMYILARSIIQYCTTVIYSVLAFIYIYIYIYHIYTPYIYINIYIYEADEKYLYYFILKSPILWWFYINLNALTHYQKAGSIQMLSGLPRRC